MQESNHARQQISTNTDIRGLGLQAGTLSSPTEEIRDSSMPYLLPLRVQQLSPPGTLRRKEVPGDSSRPTPIRQSSLKNRKSRRIQTGAGEEPELLQIEEVSTERPLSYGSDFSFVPRNLDIHPHLGLTPQLPFTFDKSIDNRIPGAQSSPALKRVSAALDQETALTRPRLGREFTSYHTAHGSVSDDGEDGRRTHSNTSEGSSLSLQSSHWSSQLREQFDGQNQTAIRDEVFEMTSRSGMVSPTGDLNATGLNMMREVSNSSLLSHSSTHPSSRDEQAHNAQLSVKSPLEGLAYASPRQKVDMEILIEDLRDELRAVSVELATSIQREMDLEDEVDRLQAGRGVGLTEQDRRTSDYFSESSISSARVSAAPSETRIQALEKMRRKAEQEKAQMRRDIAKKMEDDLVQRRAHELHRQTLEDKLRSLQETNSTADTMNQKARDLEISLEDTRRRLNDERQVRENIEELLKGLQAEIGKKEDDEIMPQLRARIEGLEAETAQMQQVTYENTRLQQELQSLKSENQALVAARQLQMDARLHDSTRDISVPTSPRSPNLTLTRTMSSIKRRSARPISGIVDASSLEIPAESLQDVEKQRDALHKTLQSLVLRYEHEARTHARQIRALEKERDRAWKRQNTRSSFTNELQHWRADFNRLRQQASNALEQKWQCEKGLSGLTIDLDRAQQENKSLRSLLEEMQLNSDRGSDPHVIRRLNQAITHGDLDQFAASQKILDLQAGLKAAEERLVAAQNASEEVLEQQEELMNDLKDSQLEAAYRGIKRSSTLESARVIETTEVLSRQNTHIQGSGEIKPLRSVLALKLVRANTKAHDPARVGELEARIKELRENAEQAENKTREIVRKMLEAQAQAATLQAESEEALKRRRTNKPSISVTEKLGSSISPAG